MTGLEHESLFVRAEEVLWRQLHDVVLVRTVADPEVTALSGTGILLWLAVSQPVTAHELATELAAAVGAPLHVVERDVRTSLADLARRGVVMQLEGP